MQDELFPNTYEAWKRCITERCKIELSQDYVKKRITVLSNRDSSERKSFEEKYGFNWTETVLSYFKQSLSN